MDCRHCIFVPCSCAAVDNVAQIFLRPTSLRFSQNDWAKMQQLKPSCFIIIGASGYSPVDLCKQYCTGCSCGPWDAVDECDPLLLTTYVTCSQCSAWLSRWSTAGCTVAGAEQWGLRDCPWWEGERGVRWETLQLISQERIGLGSSNVAGLNKWNFAWHFRESPKSKYVIKAR